MRRVRVVKMTRRRRRAKRVLRGRKKRLRIQVIQIRMMKRVMKMEKKAQPAKNPNLKRRKKTLARAKVTRTVAQATGWTIARRRRNPRLSMMWMMMG